MTQALLSLLVSLGVLAGVLVLLVWYVRECAKLRSIVGSELDGLAKAFEADIVARAKRGQDPDWIRYGDEGDHRHEFISERMRNLTTAALATGVGGTMIMLLLHFWLGGGFEGEGALEDLLGAMGFALLASGFGVGANLLILLRYLRGANTDFDEKRTAFMERLRKASNNSHPKTLTTALTEQLTERLDNVLRTSAQNFPDVIRDFNRSVGALADVAKRFHDGTASMSSAVSSLSGSVSQLESLPESLTREMTKAQGTWANATRDAQRRHLDELSEVIDRHSTETQDMLQALEDRQQAIQSITSALTESVDSLDSVPDRLRDELASAAAKVHGQHLDELRSAVAAHAKHVRQTLDALGDWKSDMAVLEERWHQQRDEQHEAWEQHRAGERTAHERVVRTLADGTSEIAATVQGLPTAFTRKLQEGANRLGREFGTRASNVVAELVQELRKQNDALGVAWGRHVANMLNQMTELRDELGKQNEALSDAWGRHVANMLNQMADMVQEGLKPTVKGIAGIGANLAEVGNQVRGTVGEFARHGEGFSGSMRDAADTFRGSSSQLLKVHEAAKASVEQIRQQHEEMYDGLDTALDELRKVLDEVAALIRTMARPGPARRLRDRLTGRVRSLLGRGDGKAEEDRE